MFTMFNWGLWIINFIDNNSCPNKNSELINADILTSSYERMSREEVDSRSPEVHREPCNEVESLDPAKRLVVSEPGIFRFHHNALKIHWRLSTILKTTKKADEVMFFNMKKYIYSESEFNKKFSSNKIKSTKNAVFFISWAPTPDGFFLFTILIWAEA